MSNLPINSSIMEKMRSVEERHDRERPRGKKHDDKFFQADHT